MLFRVYGADRETGLDQTLDVEANSPEEAQRCANSVGLLVAAVEQLGGPDLASSSPKAAADSEQSPSVPVATPSGSGPVAGLGAHGADAVAAYMQPPSRNHRPGKSIVWRCGFALILLLGIGVVLFFVSGAGKTHDLTVTVRIRDANSAALVPMQGAQVLVVSKGSAGDAILSEYASLARSNCRARAEWHRKLVDGKRRRELLVAQAKAITIGGNAGAYTDAAGSAARAVGNLDKMDKLREIKEEMYKEEALFEELSSQADRLLQESVAQQKEYREKAMKFVSTFKTTGPAGAASMQGIRGRSFVVYVMPADEGVPMLLVRDVDLGVVSAVTLGPEDDTLMKDAL